jgi:TctA family transporter
MLAAGLVAYVLEANKFPIAPAILGVVLGGMLEENFITSMIKADGNMLAFFTRPIAATLAVVTLAGLVHAPDLAGAAGEGNATLSRSAQGSSASMIPG